MRQCLDNQQKWDFNTEDDLESMLNEDNVENDTSVQSSDLQNHQEQTLPENFTLEQSLEANILLVEELNEDNMQNETSIQSSDLHNNQDQTLLENFRIITEDK